MERRLFVAAAVAAMGAPLAAHHGWSSFDDKHPLYLEGELRAVRWQNPHAELDIAVPAELKLPADLAARTMPAQTASVDAAAILKSTRLPAQLGVPWRVELAPLARMDAWKVAAPKPGDRVAVIGYASTAEKQLLRAEYLFIGDKVYGLRSSPA